MLVRISNSMKCTSQLKLELHGSFSKKVKQQVVFVVILLVSAMMELYYKSFSKVEIKLSFSATFTKKIITMTTMMISR